MDDRQTAKIRGRIIFAIVAAAGALFALRVFAGATLSYLILSAVTLAGLALGVSLRGHYDDYTHGPRLRRAKSNALPVDPDTTDEVPSDPHELSWRYGQMGQRMRRSLQLRDDESAILELIAEDTDRSIVLRSISELLANQFPGCRFRFATANIGRPDQADRTWPIVDETDQDSAWVLQAVLVDPSENPDPDVIALAQDLARLALDKARDRTSLRYQADHDVLTGLLSRRAILAELDRALAHTESVGLIYGDVDHFKSFNDSLGHLAGDDLLVEVAARIKSNATSSDITISAGRLGGDEYLCVLSSCTEAQATDFAERLEFAMRAPFTLGAITTSASMSWGGSFTYSESGNSADLLREADVALYQVKRHGRNAVRFFDEELREWTAERKRLENDLNLSITKKSGIHTDFQPQFNAKRELIGFEALGRWHRQGVGLVPPDQFIPVAVERGLMADFDHEIFRHVAHVLGSGRKEGRSFGMVSINVSAERLERADFVEATLSALRQESIDPKDVIIEITESSLLRDLSERGRRLEELRRWGIRIAVDDFGTGYSSLSYLRELPVDILKLDKEFVSDIDTSAESQAIVQAILALARALKLKTVAEGVERDSQFEILSRLGCDIFQGYLLGRPLKLDVARERAASRWRPDPFSTAYVWEDSPPEDAATLEVRSKVPFTINLDTARVQHREIPGG
jgi:diguanylate cyclase (GGDEF)-like protein